MTFVAINWLSLSITSLLFIFVIVCILMGVVVLIQRPKQDGLGAAFGGGVTDQLFGARSTDVFQKATWVLGTIFFVLSFTLAILISKQSKQKSLLEDNKPVAEAAQESPAVTPELPAEPASLINELPTVPTPSPEVVPPAEIPAVEAPAEPAPAPEEASEPNAPEAPATEENSGNKTE